MSPEDAPVNSNINRDGTSSNPPSGSFAFDLNYLSLLDLGWPGFVASRVLVERGNPTHPQSEATWPQMFWSP
jgi:hypothetical protein